MYFQPQIPTIPIKMLKVNIIKLKSHLRIALTVPNL